ncbi:hypothetical protein ANO14919_082800 [Xylariales sp. No.14919]|nr:hypothetical protein ANO14919_082800 [Xylariales sp. No.14919]
MQSLETSHGSTMDQTTSIMEDRIRKDVEISISSEILPSQNGIIAPRRSNGFPNYDL